MNKICTSTEGDLEVTSMSNEKESLANCAAESLEQKISRVLEELNKCYMDEVNKNREFLAHSAPRILKMQKKFTKADKMCDGTDNNDKDFETMRRKLYIEKQEVLGKFNSFFNNKYTKALQRRNLFLDNTRTQIVQLQRTLERVKSAGILEESKIPPIPDAGEFKEAAENLEKDMTKFYNKWQEMQLIPRITYLCDRLQLLLHPELELLMNGYDRCPANYNFY